MVCVPGSLVLASLVACALPRVLLRTFPWGPAALWQPQTPTLGFSLTSPDVPTLVQAKGLLFSLPGLLLAI